MDKRQGLVPRAVLLGALVALLACSRLTHVPGAPSPTGAPRPVAAEWDLWLGRANGIAGIGSFVLTAVAIGLAVKAYNVSRRQLLTGEQQLRHQLEAIQEDQRRIADDIRRRPLLVIGFPLKENPHTYDRKASRRFYPAQIDPTANYRRTFMLQLHNAGQRTALNVIVDLWLADGGTLGSGDYGARGLFSGGLRLPSLPAIHPEREEQVSFEVNIDRALISTDLELLVVASFDDYPPHAEILSVGIGLVGENDDSVWPRRAISPTLANQYRSPTA